MHEFLKPECWDKKEGGDRESCRKDIHLGQVKVACSRSDPIHSQLTFHSVTL